VFYSLAANSGGGIHARGRGAAVTRCHLARAEEQEGASEGRADVPKFLRGVV